MVEYIAKERAKDLIVVAASGNSARLARMLGKLEDEPPVDVAPVVHARWEWTWDTCSMGIVKDLRCSHCQRKLKRDGEYEGNYPPYCQYCGAKMDGGDSNG